MAPPGGAARLGHRWADITGPGRWPEVQPLALWATAHATMLHDSSRTRVGTGRPAHR